MVSDTYSYRTEARPSVFLRNCWYVAARLVTLGIDAGGAHARRLMARAAGDGG